MGVMNFTIGGSNGYLHDQNKIVLYTDIYEKGTLFFSDDSY